MSAGPVARDALRRNPPAALQNNVLTANAMFDGDDPFATDDHRGPSSIGSYSAHAVRPAYYGSSATPVFSPLPSGSGGTAINAAIFAPAVIPAPLAHAPNAIVQRVLAGGTAETIVTPAPAQAQAGAPQAEIPAGDGPQAGPQGTTIIESFAFGPNLDGWTATEKGGAAPNAGSVVGDATGAVMHEGNSFLVTLARSFEITADTRQLRLTYENLSFDTTTVGAINDAFEVALVDDAGQPVVFPFTTGRDAFWNATEELATQAGSQVTEAGTTITLDLSAVPEGTQATVSFRLVSNDGDTQTSVRITRVELLGEGSDSPPLASIRLANDTAPDGLAGAPYRTDGLTNDPTVTGDASDLEGIQTVEIDIDGALTVDITADVVDGTFTFDPGALAPGPHELKLRVTDTAGQVAEDTVDVRVNLPPVADAGGDLMVGEGATASFDGGSSTDTEDAIFQYTWLFDDGTSVDGSTANKHYVKDGTYDVTLKVADTAGSVSEDIVQVTVVNAPPVIAALDDRRIDEGDTLALNAALTDPGVLDTHTATVDWGDGTIEPIAVVIENGHSRVEGSHRYLDDGSYLVGVTVTDNGNAATTESFTATVDNVAPVVTLTGDVTGNEGSIVDVVGTFTDAGVLDTHTATVLWSDGSSTPGTVIEADGEGSVTAHHVYADNGVYPVRVNVLDDDGGLGTDEITATIDNVPPSVVPAAGHATIEGSLLALTVATFTDPGFTSVAAGTTETFTAIVDWGDGTVESGVVVSVTGDVGVPTAGTVRGEHRYADNGDYAVTVTVTDDDGGAGSASFVVRVDNAPPTVESLDELSGNEGATMHLVAPFADAGAFDTHAATVDWGDGTQSPAAISFANGTGVIAASHVYADNGVYAIQVVVLDDSGATTTATTQGTIDNVAPAVSAAVTTPAGGATASVGQAVAIAGSFNDPGFTSIAAGSVETFAVLVDWGDGSVESVDAVVTPGADGLPTQGTLAASHPYVAAGTYAITVRVQDDDGGIGTAVLSVRVGQTGATKFFVVDQSAHETFRYDAAGVALGSADLAHFNSRPRGIASNTAGDTYWVIDASKKVFVYSADGTLRGTWSPKDLNQPEDITTDGKDIWIVDAAKDRVYRYTNAAGRRNGSQSPSSSFALKWDNRNATGIVTDGSKIWVTDTFPSGDDHDDDKSHSSDDKDKRQHGLEANGFYGRGNDDSSSSSHSHDSDDDHDHDERGHGNDKNAQVFVYSKTGSYLGSWKLDGRNDDPSGITLTPGGSSTDVWVVDRHDDVVYHYASGLSRRSGGLAATSIFALADENRHPEGIADPPVAIHPTVILRAEPAETNVTVGAPVLISGTADTLSGWGISETANEISTTTYPGSDAIAFDAATATYVIRTFGDGGGNGFQFTRISLDGAKTVLGTNTSLKTSTHSDLLVDPLTGGFIVADERGKRIALVDPTTLAETTLFSVPWTMNPRANGSGQQRYAIDPDDPSQLYFWDGSVSGLYRLNRTTLSLETLLELDQDTPDGEHFNTFANDILFDANTRTLLLSDGLSRSIIEIDPFASPISTSLLVADLPVKPSAMAFDNVNDTLYVALGDSIYAMPRRGGPLTQVTYGAFVEPVVGLSQRGDRSLAVLSQQDDALYHVHEIKTHLESVAIEGSPVNVLDAAGAFFHRVNAKPGTEVLHLQATDSSGRSGTATLQVVGFASDEQSVYSSLANVTGSLVATYGRTSFDEAAELLYADLAIRNAGQYPADVPLLVGVTNISDPTVRVREADGVTPDGVPYYDYSALVADGTLSPGETTDARPLVFHNPNRVPFTYDLVFFGKLNQAPAITTIPVVEAIVGRTYAYNVDATDPDGDAVQLALVEAPAAAAIGANTGALSWSPGPNDLGTHPITIRASDGRGGVAEQRYTLSVIEPPPNRPPMFTSVPIVDAEVGQPYTYDADATDPDDDPLEYVLIAGPDGLAVDPNSGVVTWSPSANNLIAGPASPAGALLPIVPGLSVEVYANVQDATQFTFDPLGNAYVGADPQGDVGKVRHIGRGGVTVEPYGSVDLPDPDAVAFDTTGIVSGVPGSVLVGEGLGGSPWQGRLDAIHPDQTVHTILGPTTALGNITYMQLDSAGRLLILHDDSQDVLVVEGGASRVLINNPAPIGRIAVDAQDRIFVGGGDGVIRVYDRMGTLVNAAFATGAGGLLAIGSGGDFGADLYVMQNGNLLRFDANGNRSVVGGGFGVVNEMTFGSDGALYLSQRALARILRVMPIPAPGTLTQDHRVKLAASDDRGGYAFQEFVIRLAGEPNNHAPIIVSTPPNPGIVGRPYTYDVDAIDPDGDILTYSLTESTVPLTIDPATGEVTWSNPDPDPGYGFAFAAARGETRSVATDVEGNIYVSVTFSNTIDADPGPDEFLVTGAGGLDVLVAKYSAAGKLVWARQNGGVDDDLARELAVDDAGNVYVTGLFQGTFDFDPGPGEARVTSNGGYDAFVQKLNVDGELEWVRQFGGTLDDLGWVVDVDAFGDVVAAGYFRGPVDFDPGGGQYVLATEIQCCGLFVVKLSSDGEFDWAKAAVGDVQFGAGVLGNSRSPEVDTDADGNIVVAVGFGGRGEVKLIPGPAGLTFDSNGSDSQNAAGLLKLSPDGDLVWAKQVNGPGFVAPHGLAVDGDGNVLVGGRFDGAIDFDPSDSGVRTLTSVNNSQDGFIAKFDEAGNFAWAMRAGDAADGAVDDLAVDDHGNVYGVGALRGDLDPDPDNTFELSQTAGEVVWSLDPGGRFRHAYNYGIAETFDIEVDCLGNLFTAGLSNGNNNFDFTGGEHPRISPENVVAYVAKFTQAGARVRVDDGRGGFDTQCFQIDVVRNEAPEIAPIYDKTVAVGDTLTFTIGNPGLRAGELLIGSASSTFGQISGVDPANGTERILLQLPRQLQNEYLTPNFQARVVILDNEGHILTHAPISALDPANHYGVRLNPATGNYTVPDWHRVLAHLPNGNYLVQERYDLPLSEVNLVTGRVRFFGSAPLPIGGGSTVADAAHLPNGQVFIDVDANIYLLLGGINSVFSLNLETGVLAPFAPTPFTIGSGIAATNDRRLVLSGGGHIYSIDLRTRSLEQITTDSISGLWDVAIGEDGIVYATTDSNRTVLAIDPVAHTQRTVRELDTPFVKAVFAVSRFAADGAIDSDDDVLVFSMKNLPSGASFGSATKTFSWTPTASQGGRFDVTAMVSDGRGGVDEWTFTINVVGGTAVSGNRGPLITSQPVTAASVDTPYRYDVVARDDDLDPLQFELVVKPIGMAIDSATGRVVWTPAANQAGDQEVIVRVSDGQGGVDLQSFAVAVAPPNHAPVITSQPTNTVVLGHEWQYQVRAQDVDGDPLTYQIVAGRGGPSIDSTTGLMRWTPTAFQTGPRTIGVLDGRGGVAFQTFDLNVFASAPNDPPAISSAPRTTTQVGYTYHYDVLATDPNGDPLSYLLTEFPPGMTIDDAGHIAWSPTGSQVGPHAVALRVEDGRGGFATQQFTLTVTSQTVNRPPSIASTPSFAASVGRPYAYDAAGVDPDGDALAWSLDAAPAGMSIDPARGTVRWLPAAGQVGTHTVAVRAVDPFGEYATQTYTLTVRSVNVPPQIRSTPPTMAVAGELYVYGVAAADVDGDRLAFSLNAAPAGMTIDAVSGLIRWTPADAQEGLQSVAVRVDDGRGGSATQSYSVLVITPVNDPVGANRSPVIVSTPSFVASAGAAYAYDADATDPDGDALTFALVDPPAGMTVNPASGLVSWTPTAAQIGEYLVVLTATDSIGAIAGQTFVITVRDANRAPVITSSPVQVVTAGLPYRYDVRANDPDGDPLSYTLDAAALALGMSVDRFGRISWSPQISAIGVHRIAVTVADNRGAFQTQTFDVAVVADAQTPGVSLAVSENPVLLGSLVTFVVSATDNVGVTAIGLSINGLATPLDGQGRLTLVADQPGDYALVASASDAAGNTGLASTTLRVIVPDDTWPEAAITSPADGATITEPIDVIGTASDANLTSYVVEAIPAAGGAARELFRGTTSVVGGVLGRFDPMGLVNDVYVLRLTATDAGGNVSLVERTVNVAGDLKVGNFTLSFTDLTIPVSGIPITVSRTYDTLQAAQRDELGFGWRLEIKDVDLRTSVAPTGNEADGFFNPFYDGAKVFVTTPGGRREGFTFEPEYKGFCISSQCLNIYEPAFTADDGVTSSLSVDRYTLLRNDDGEYSGFSLGDVAYNPASEFFGGRYVLTTKEGIRYEIDGLTGDARSISDPNNNTLTFTADGVVSSTGQRVTLERDPQGRVSAVVDPAGNRVRYRYDARNDLVGVIDRDGNETTFVYDTARPHYLVEVKDPLGRSGVRSEYDDQGRLITLRDAAGNPVRLVHDPDNFTETVRDALDHATTFEYDARGNVVRETDALGGVTERTYDDRNNMLTETVCAGVLVDCATTTFSYDGLGNVRSETDPLGHTTRYTYNAMSQVLTTTDPLGNTTTNTYDARGNLLTTTDAAGQRTTFTYDAAGNQTAIADAAGNVTRFEYDARGNLTRQVDALLHETTFTYDANGNQLTQTTTVTGPAGPMTVTTTTEYDVSGRPVKVTDADGGVTRTEYDALGRLRATIDALNRRTEFEYDERGLLVATRFADGTATTIGYDVLGRRSSSTDRGGATTGFEYDAVGRLTATIHPDATPADPLDNPRSRTEYDLAGKVVAQIDERGNRTEFEYDLAGRQTVVRDALLHETTTAYDAAGRVVSTTDALGNTTTFVLDALGRQTETIFADDTRTSREYDALGRVVSETDQADRTTRFEYDALGRLTAVVDAMMQRTVYGYDEAGNLVTQQDALGTATADPADRITRYEYDKLGRRTATILPLGQRSTTAYDAAGNVLATTDFDGERTTFDYDANNRLLAKHFDGGTPEAASVSFTYTDTGQRETYTDARGTTTWAYDERDRLLSRTEPGGQRIAYTYDEVGNRLATTTAAGTIHYTFDALNRMETVRAPEDPVGRETVYEYDEVGRLERTDFPNGTWETRAYDDVGHLLVLENHGAAGIIDRFAYTLDPTGNRTAVEELGGRRVDYAYDAVYRLLGESITDSVAGNRQIAYTYDPVGNRLTRSDSAEGLTTYRYDDNDRLLEELLAGDATRYTYDENGNTLSKVHSATDQAFYEWDAENRLVAADVTDSAGSRHVDYRYDADGIRVSSAVGGEKTLYLLDTSHPFQQVALETTEGGIVLVSYVHGNDLISQNRRGEDGSYAKSIYHVDGLGSTRALTNALGQVTDRYVYEAFGRTIGQVGSTGNVYLFAGEQRDGNVGLDYLRARYLHVESGRFFGPDSFRGLTMRPVTLHRFTYGNLNPARNLDPSGNFTLADVVSATAIQSNLRAIATLRVPLTLCRAIGASRILQTAIDLAQLIRSARIFTKVLNEGIKQTTVGFKYGHLEFGATIDADLGKSQLSALFSLADVRQRDAAIEFRVGPNEVKFSGTRSFAMPLLEVDACRFVRVARLYVFAEYSAAFSTSEGATTSIEFGIGVGLFGTRIGAGKNAEILELGLRRIPIAKAELGPTHGLSVDFGFFP